MKKIVRFISAFVFIIIFISCFAVFSLNAAERKMSVSSSGIKNGTIADQYGMRGKQKKAGIPTLSLPLSISDAPNGTICYAVQITDPDSSPEWVHWLAVNIEAADLPENASIDLADSMIQGKNDFGSLGYGGPTPPDRPHTYVITVYALDAKVDLKDNFSRSQFRNATKGHVLAEAVIKGRYRN